MRVLALLILGLLAGGARAELLGTYPHRKGPVRLMTELCRADDPGSGQRAQQMVDGWEREGCWGVDRAGNPIVTWSDGSELVLDGAKVRLSPGMAGRLEQRTDALRPRTPAEAPRATAPEP